MSKDGTDGYTPISCATYSAYELAILRRERLRLHWVGEDGVDHLEVVRPLDLQTRDHQEFLVFEHRDRRRSTIRLDRIVSFRKAEGVQE